MTLLEGVKCCQDTLWHPALSDGNSHNSSSSRQTVSPGCWWVLASKNITMAGVNVCCVTPFTTPFRVMNLCWSTFNTETTLHYIICVLDISRLYNHNQDLHYINEHIDKVIRHGVHIVFFQVVWATTTEDPPMILICESCHLANRRSEQARTWSSPVELRSPT